MPLSTKDGHASHHTTLAEMGLVMIGVAGTSAVGMGIKLGLGGEIGSAAAGTVAEAAPVGGRGLEPWVVGAGRGLEGAGNRLGLGLPIENDPKRNQFFLT